MKLIYESSNQHLRKVPVQLPNIKYIETDSECWRSDCFELSSNDYRTICRDIGMYYITFHVFYRFILLCLLGRNYFILVYDRMYSNVI